MTSAAKPTAPIQVLLVEDSEGDYLHVELLLKKWAKQSYAVTWCQDAESGLAALEKQNFEVCLCDYRLGPTTGIEFIQAARQINLTCPIILLTGWEDPDTDYSASEVGAADYLSKNDLNVVRLEKSIRYARRHALMTNTVRQTHQLLATILETLPIIAGRIDQQGLILEIAGSGLRRFGYRVEDLVGQSIQQLPLVHDRQMRRALAGRGQEFFVDGVDEQGPWHFSVRLSFDREHGSGALFFAQDQTEQRRLEKQLLDINDHRQEAIGRDLHDGLGQHLTGISCLAMVLRDKLNKTHSPEAESAGLIASLVQEAIEQTRALSRGLAPVKLEQFGLQAALEDLVTSTAQIHQITCRLEVQGGELFLDHGVSVHLYRIAQEALNNALRHGRAKTILIELIGLPHSGSLKIMDDGIGFNENEMESFGLGLHMMQFRANLIGANFAVRSQLGQGTQVSIMITKS